MKNMTFSFCKRSLSKRNLYLFLLLIVFIVGNLVISCQKAAPRVYSRSGFFFGGIPGSFQIYDTPTKPLTEAAANKIFDDIFKRLQTIDDRMSYHIAASEISTINAQAGKSAVRVSDDTFEVIQLGLEYAQKFGGRFDISVGPLVQLWGIGTEQAHLPKPAEIAEKLALVDYKQVKIDKQTKEVFLPKAGMDLDLGALAKGYATDEVANIIKAAGVEQAIIDIGGNIMVLGHKPAHETAGKGTTSTTLWKVGIRHPLQSESENNIIGVLKTAEQSVVTSGVYERFFMVGDKRYHHILDTKTGYPIENSLESVTIITHPSVLADIFSTGIFALGLEEGRRFVEATPGVDAIFITKNKEVYLTKGIQSSNFELLDKEYKLIHD